VRPELFSIPIPGLGSIPIYTYGFMVMVGLLAALFVASRRARAVGMDAASLSDLAVWVMISGIVGARLFYLVQFRQDFDWRLFRLDLPTFASASGLGGLLAGGSLGLWAARRKVGSLGRRPWVCAAVTVASGIAGARLGYGLAHPQEVDFGVFRIDRGGLVFFGGLFGAFVVGLAYVRARGLPLGAVADVVAPSLSLGQAFGRIGCFLNGCCFGTTTSLPWAVRYPQSYAGTREIPNPAFDFHVRHLGFAETAGHSLPVHPTQIYESLLDFSLFLFLAWYVTRRARNGDALLLYGVLYSALRFGIEFLRGDNAPTFTGLTVAQNLSLVLFPFCLVWLLARRAGRARPLLASAAGQGGA
jgi:phosphatidylglycerol:prolipoprotein diacylglycerol transferase